MPNILFEEFTEKGEAGIREVTKAIFERELRQVTDRSSDGQDTWMDSARKDMLSSALTNGLLPVVDQHLIELVGALLSRDDGRRWMTIGPLRDVLVQLAFEPADGQPSAFIDIVIGKLLPQVQTLETAQIIADAVADLADGGRVAQAVIDMTGPTGDVRPLV
jgi:hypothetical protein